MKASTFIKVALIDQMQQIADLGLWFHLSRLLPSGVELLGAVAYGMDIEETQANDSEYFSRLAKHIYGDFFPIAYPFYPNKKEFFSVSPTLFLTSNESEAYLHLTEDEKGFKYVHVPAWFQDFKAACQFVLKEIEAGKIEDIEVLKTLEK